MLDYLKHGLIDKAATLYKIHGVEVFSFPIFNFEFCAKFIAEINHFNQTSMPKGRPNSMNNYGVRINLIGFKSFIFLTSHHFLLLSYRFFWMNWGLMSVC